MAEHTQKIILHSLLETRGGAARVADLLAAELPALGFDAERSFEVAETTKGDAALARNPWREQLAQAAREGHIIHIHATANWPETLDFLRSLKARTVLTLHDERLAAGGCVFSMGCDGLFSACPDPCPRGFTESAKTAHLNRQALEALAPTLVAPSAWMKRRFTRAVPGSQVKVVANGVEWPDTLPSRAEARSSIGLAPGARAALFLAHGGEEAAYKAGDRWQVIWAQISSKVPGALAFMAGGRSREREPGLIRLPYLDRASLSRLMRACDLLLYPTLADNHPLVILEAFAMGLAPVAFDIGGIREQIIPNRTGLLIPPGDIATFITQAAQLLSSPARCRTLGDSAAATGRTRFTATRMARDYAGIYEAASGGKPF